MSVYYLESKATAIEIDERTDENIKYKMANGTTRSTST